MASGPLYVGIDLGVPGAVPVFYERLTGKIWRMDDQKQDQTEEQTREELQKSSGERQPSNQTDGPSVGGQGTSGDADSAAIGDGPSGGATDTSTTDGDSSATGAGPSGGAE